MLYFSIVPDGKSTTINPTGDKPYHLCVHKTLDDESVIFDKEEGVRRLFFQFCEPKNWQAETHDITSHVGGYRMYNSSPEHILLENGLFFYDKEYTIEFLTSRFADELTAMKLTLSEFDQGVLWLALLQINSILIKFDSMTPATNEKEISRMTRALGSVVHNTERSISLVTKLIHAAHRAAECYPGSLHDVRTFTIKKAYLYYAYLFLLPLKEFYAGKVLPCGREHGMTDFLLDVCPSINYQAFIAAYDLTYEGESTGDMLTKLIKSPGREVPPGANVHIDLGESPIDCD